MTRATTRGSDRGGNGAGWEEEIQNELHRLKEELESQLAANQTLKERVLELYTLYHLSRALSLSLQLNELFDLTMKVLAQTLELNQFCLMLLDESTGKLVIQASHGLPREIGKPGTVCMEDGVSWTVVNSAAPVLLNDVGRGSHFFYFKGSRITAGSYLGVPLLRRDGRVLGVLNAHKPMRNGFSDSEVHLFQRVADQVGLAIEKALIFQQTRELMHRDELTNLYNRRYFFERFEREVYRAHRYHHPLSLLMIDIDHFKNLNDAYGHKAGDLALQKLARLLEHKLRKADLLARYGGEEFLILLPETNKKGACRVAEKLRTEVEKADFSSGPKREAAISFTITVGVANLPQDTTDGRTLLDLADKALYYGKARGRNQVCAQIPDGIAE